jgi:hypothetical protein
MAGHSRPKDGVASLAYVPAIRVFLCSQNVDARHKAGHDIEMLVPQKRRRCFAGAVVFKSTAYCHALLSTVFS